MSTNADLVRLFDELKLAGSPLRRMKILGRAWRTLRRLSPAARSELAAQVGIDGAGDVLEQLAGKNRKLSPAALLGALEALRSTEPADLQRTLRDLGRPASRRALVDRGLDIVTRALNDEPASEEGGVVPAPSPPTSMPLDVPVVAAVPVAGVEPAAPAVIAKSEAIAKHAATAKPVATARPAATAVVSATTGAVAAATSKRSSSAARGHAVTSARPRPFVTPTGTPPAERASASRTGLADELLATTRLSAKFRILRARSADARGLSLEELRRVIEAFPAGWSRRRALTCLLDQNIPGDLHHAIDLIEQLESPLSQRWCVARILHAWPLTDHERAALLERRGRFMRRAG